MDRVEYLLSLITLIVSSIVYTVGLILLKVTWNGVFVIPIIMQVIVFILSFYLLIMDYVGE